MASTEPCLHSSIGLRRLRFAVKLGWGEEERKTPQFVFFDIQLRFPALPKGCITDELNETVCYGEMSGVVRQICQQGEFRLIEHLGYRVYSAVKEFIPPRHLLWVKITKEKPPVPELLDGSTFSLGDWVET